MQESEATRRRCAECGAMVLRFVTRHGLVVELDDHRLPIDRDLRALHDEGAMVWTFTPFTGRWSFKNGFDRDRREVRAQHVCATATSTSERERETS